MYVCSQVPEFRWAENDTELWVTIEINNAKDADVKISADEITAKATAGEKKYELQFKTKKTLDAEVSGCDVDVRCHVMCVPWTTMPHECMVDA